MAGQDSSIEESGGRLESEIRGLGLMIKGLFECVGSSIEHAEVDALHDAYTRLYSSYREFSIAAFERMTGGLESSVALRMAMAEMEQHGPESIGFAIREDHHD